MAWDETTSTCCHHMIVLLSNSYRSSVYAAGWRQPSSNFSVVGTHAFVISTCSVMAHMKLAPDSHVPEGKLEPDCSTQPLSLQLGMRCGLAWKRFIGEINRWLQSTLMTLKHDCFTEQSQSRCTSEEKVA